MRTGAYCIALGSLCFFLTACGGGGGSSGGTTPVTSGLPPTHDSSGGSASPGPPPSTYPFSNGNALIYAGQLTQTFQNFPEVSVPGSSPEPTSVTTTNVTQNVTMSSNQSFNGGNGLYDLHSVEADAVTSGLKTTTSTTDTYELVAQNGASSSQLVDYGSKFVDEAGDSITTSYSPDTILDQLPETPGAQWSNGAAASIQEAIAGNGNGSAVTVQRTIAANGSYTEATTYPPDYSAPGYTGVGQIQENADGSGSYAFVANGGPATVTFSVPVAQASGPPLITVAVYQQLNPTAADAPVSGFFLPTWYGTSAALYGETDRNVGIQPVPASCNLSTQFPQNATELLQTINRTDTVLGYTEQETTANYVANGFGTVCTVLQDKQSFVYAWNGDQPFVFTQTPPLKIITISETLALQPGSNFSGAPASAVGARKASSGVRTLTSLSVGPALRVSFDRAVSNLRHQHVTALVRATQRLRARGGAQR